MDLKHAQNKNDSKGGRKYYLDRSELRLPPPVLCMSDFERHAQRKNRAIQVTFDDELQKIGIDCKVVNKFLTSDVRRFCHRFPPSKRQICSLSHRKHLEHFPDVQYSKLEKLDIQYGGQTKTKPDGRTSDIKDSLTIPPILNFKTVDKSVDKGTVAREKTHSKTNSEGIKCAKEKRILPQSAKLHRVKDDVMINDIRPKSTNAARHVTFWDMMDEQKTNNTTTLSSELKRDQFNQSQFPLRFQELKLIKSYKRDVFENSDRKLPRTKKIGWSSPIEDPEISTYNSSKSLTSFLHFDKNRACVDLKRELRVSAANRKGAMRRRKLSELLTTEKNCYEESLNKMATRLRDEKLLEFCKESCRGMDNVFEYNL